ncbi:MAG TPA: TAXI family TRAP transporter solute-binding subunit [Micropepsaceae bacterium]|nr:TAXI family TRAP transporter solute-binding subunit [Micropepsaceae bacterium]
MSNSSRNAHVLYCVMRENRRSIFWSLAAGLILALGATTMFSGTAPAQGIDNPQRIAFQISTGSTTGTYFPVGSLLAQLLSHPPGVGRCEAANICGPSGLIVSTRASQGSVANILAVNSGMTTSGLAQTDVIALAMAGQGPFRKGGPTKQIRVIANLYGEDLHLVVAKNSKIKNVADLRGKRVSLSSENSGTIATARAVLAAYRLSEKSIVPNYDSAETAVDLLQAGKIDAMFFVGGTPVNLLQQLLDQEVAVLVPINGDGLKRLLAKERYLSAHVIPKGTYGNGPEVETVSVDALWITDASEPDALIYGMLKAVYNPANRSALQAGKLGSHFMELASGAKDLSAPLHPGAVRFFTEAGVLKPDEKVALPAKPPAGKS